MYLSFSMENIITIGVMLLCWLLALHLLGQAGVTATKYLSVGS